MFKIKIKTKNKKIQTVNIKTENKPFYKETKKGSGIFKKLNHKQILHIKERIRFKKKLESIKKAKLKRKRNIQFIHESIGEEKPLKIDKFNCKFNYGHYYKNPQGYLGYCYNKSVEWHISSDITDIQYLEYVSILKDFIETSYYSLPCTQRKSYCKIHFRFISELHEDFGMPVELAFVATTISSNIKSVIDQSEKNLADLVSKAEGYQSLIIFRLEFVNRSINGGGDDI